ncbi:MAG: hypothetical protein R8J84_08145 [Mariprofundales bacterium]
MPVDPATRPNPLTDRGDGGVNALLQYIIEHPGRGSRVLNGWLRSRVADLPPANSERSPEGMQCA